MKISEPHHDGSPLYVSNLAPKPGERITLSIRIPDSYRVEQVQLRIYHDGEARFFPLKRDSKIKGKPNGESWWRVKVEVMNVENNYRFLITSGTNQSWLTAAGIRDFEPNSATDFKLLAKARYPEWINQRVFYQIFPDRFARSGVKRELPDWALPQNWDEAHNGNYKAGSQDFYGGDFAGIESKLSYIKKLGVGGIYFTPIFPSQSNHRYDASSFDHVDPLLGGDNEFLSFVKAARTRKLKLIIDLTTNHVGAGHTWFKRALQSKSAKERGYFFWDPKISCGYVGWWGIPDLPKLNFSSMDLRRALYKGKRSALQRWLQPPFSLDGWRIDVGNMTGVYRDSDYHLEIAREIRTTMDAVSADSWLVAENADMHPIDLDGSSWHGTMNYQGFARPLWSWINQNADVRPGGQGMQSEMPKISTAQFVKTMREFNGGIPWRSLLASMNLLDSHDTARMRNIVGGDRELHLSAMVLLLTYPGVPSIFAGDEIGLQGAWGEDARRPMPWDREDLWDHEFLASTKELIAIRTKSKALAIGGLRFIEVGEDHFTFAREIASETIIVQIGRRPLSSITKASKKSIFSKGDLPGFTQLFSSSHATIWRAENHNNSFITFL